MFMDRFVLNQDYGDLQDWDDAGASFSPSPLIPLPSRERGILSVGFSWCPPPFTSGLTSL